MGEKYADEIRNCKFALDDDLAERSRVEQRAQLRQFKLLLSKRHPESEAIFAAHGEAKLTTFSGAISWLGENSDVSLPVLTGKLHYKQFAGNDPNDEAVVDLFNHCPPFRAFCIASLMPQYDSLLRDRNKGQKFGAGWNDLAMSIYLPYCDHFVTNDLEQQACLREVAIRASLATAVISYDEFSRSLLG